ncbi:carbohydrate kinase family protein [Streptomyces sp. TR02-1]|uniref:carbohydrate kinase family protein n=1 Tax=Streptomyces sp. TR02-1 TaxID=3385977 RepID=UPI0039A25042
MTAAEADLACFSYLAHTQVLHVDTYPRADHGAEVHSTVTSLAADGPITALTAARTGLRTTLVTNQVGSDATGQHVRRVLAAEGVRNEATGPTPSATPQMTVVADRAGTRTWFADLTHAYISLKETDTSPLGRARMAYIDCYRVLTEHAVGAIRTAARCGVPLLLNLGNDPLDPAVRSAAEHATVWAVQTGLPEEQEDQAEAVATHLLGALRPHAAVVTLGAGGAVAVTSEGTHRVTARAVPVVHTHGAGAAFSAGLATAHLEGRPLASALRQACDVGSAHCSTRPPGSTPARPHLHTPASASASASAAS